MCWMLFLFVLKRFCGGQSRTITEALISLMNSETLANLRLAAFKKILVIEKIGKKAVAKTVVP